MNLFNVVGFTFPIGDKTTAFVGADSDGSSLEYSVGVWAIGPGGCDGEPFYGYGWTDATGHYNIDIPDGLKIVLPEDYAGDFKLPITLTTEHISSLLKIDSSGKAPEHMYM